MFFIKRKMCGRLDDLGMRVLNQMQCSRPEAFSSIMDVHSVTYPGLSQTANGSTFKFFPSTAYRPDEDHHDDPKQTSHQDVGTGQAEDRFEVRRFAAAGVGNQEFLWGVAVREKRIGACRLDVSLSVCSVPHPESAPMPSLHHDRNRDVMHDLTCVTLVCLDQHFVLVCAAA